MTRNMKRSLMTGDQVTASFELTFIDEAYRPKANPKDIWGHKDTVKVKTIEEHKVQLGPITGHTLGTLKANSHF